MCIALCEKAEQSQECSKRHRLCMKEKSPQYLIIFFGASAAIWNAPQVLTIKRRKAPQGTSGFVLQQKLVQPPLVFFFFFFFLFYGPPHTKVHTGRLGLIMGPLPSVPRFPRGKLLLICSYIHIILFKLPSQTCPHNPVILVLWTLPITNTESLLIAAWPTAACRKAAWLTGACATAARQRQLIHCLMTAWT
jgi:hypothetical protein